MNYTRHLELAVRAAQRAGEILLEEFNRPGGPRGAIGDCPSDTIAERAIRDLLAAGFPDHGMVGEELGGENRRASGVDGHVWLIDPNDGTSAFQRGWRGAAVSIALLRSGVPILGVVNAYAARAGAGDLIAWAEGQPLTRNGVPIEVHRPATVDGSCTVFVSQAADENPAANAALCAPARFRAVPGIAYRLALAAVGDGIAGVSLHTPTDYDVAGGHALLRASGGDLFTFDGVPLTYSVAGRSVSGPCVGGEASFARELALRDWSAVLARQRPTRGGHFRAPLWPSATTIHADCSRLNRAQGSLLGLLAGDNLGALVEFQDSAHIARAWRDGPRTLVDGGHWSIAAGQPTDDGELAMMLARSLLTQGCYDAETVARAYVHWYSSEPFDVGLTIGNALRAGLFALEQQHTVAQPLRTAAAANTASQANGALMRIAPLAIFGHRMTPAKLAALARDDASLTHAHPVCQDANAVYTVALAHAIASGADATAVYAVARDWAARHACSAVAEVVEAAAHTAPNGPALSGWVLVALHNAFYQLLHADSAVEGIVASVRSGGDTDTNAAIAGALLGGVHGVNTLPAQWLDRVLSCRPLTATATTRHPRPPEFWPVDCLMIAEALLCLEDEADT